MLTNNEKLVILCLKGHFSKYENPLIVIMAEIYLLEHKDVTKRLIQSNLANLFKKLYRLKAIEMNYEESVEWLLEEMMDIGSRPLASQSIYNWLYFKVQHCKPQQLDLNNVDRLIEAKMKLKENVSTN
ncbi:hypothetical protein ACOMCU_01200 [Lysinibacillus sp. UGB7]|uniref:hypothetical protein n=1 Tax=Lysinibacillus sp. UGB7 TaxID=3411039 RepID=UPI003B788FFF